MNEIKHYVLPENTNRLYTEEAISSIGLTRDVAAKINELVDAYNELSKEDLQWKQTQEGIIRKGALYMKDNLVNTLYDLLKIYDKDEIKNAMMEAYGEELEALTKAAVYITPQMFGAVGDGFTNDSLAIENAIAALNPGETLYFPKGTYLMTGKPVEIKTPNITFDGEGLIVCDYGFRPKASHFKVEGLRFEGLEYSLDCKAFAIENYDNPVIENFTFKDCYFKNFFYSVYAVGGAYEHDGTEAAKGYPVRDIVIENCYSTTYTDRNAAHFQCIQVENISYMNNRTYGGQNASSYNAIKGNGFIRVIGNYDHNNSYASCEVENGSGNAVIANNTFNAKIWVDDSYSVVVNGNTTKEGVFVTVGSNVGDCENVVISNNVCKNVKCEQFGTYNGGIIRNVSIHGNTINGNNSHGIFLHGNAVAKAKIVNNFITGANTNDIAVQRNEQLNCYISGNIGNDKILLIAGTGGNVYALDNHCVTVQGTRNSLPVSHYERAFDGLKVKDTNGVEYRVNVNTSGSVYATKY